MVKAILIFGGFILIAIILGVWACAPIKDHDRYDSY